jgi:pSer/pThr/pTyr-binding forkhead associated (FHA) protein
VSKDFYNLWLKIPPNPLPPDHYTLLGLDLFQHDPALSEARGRHRFSLIKVYEDHPDREYREGAHTVMSRIALAKTVLGNPVTKRQYDRQLVAEWMQGFAAGLISASLQVAAGHTKVGREIRLKRGHTVRIGSSRTVGLSLAGSRMNPVHASLSENKGYWTLKAHGDSVVTVNGNRIEEEALAAKDAVELGGYRLRFHLAVGNRLSAMTVGERIRLRMLRAASVEEPWIEALAGESIVVGSGQPALWRLPGDDVDDIHCRFDWTQEGWEITSLGGWEGAQVNGVPVTNQALSENDRITVGQYTFAVEFGGK